MAATNTPDDYRLPARGNYQAPPSPRGRGLRPLLRPASREDKGRSENFNGKIGRPRILAAALSLEQVPEAGLELEAKKGGMDGREFLARASIFGAATAMAYSMLDAMPPAHAQEAPKKGGALRISMLIFGREDSA
ncbi:hypothetical protein NKJ71_30715 [Mesorhizobium sp. M0050]|uniref:hypothetical protein n=1 Tax=Mesorhizobium sp. M0050 TaxID=2956861 RepID=UPI00333C363C